MPPKRRGTGKRGRPRIRPPPEDDPGEGPSRQVAPTGVTSPPARTTSRPRLLPPTTPSPPPVSPAQSSIEEGEEMSAEQARGSRDDRTTRQRHPKFSTQQNRALVELYVQHHPKLHGAQSHRTTGAQKRRLWQELCNAVNAVGAHPRTLKQVQKRVSDIIRTTKKALTKLGCPQGHITRQVVSRLPQSLRRMAPIIASETVLGVDGRDDTDDWHPECRELGNSQDQESVENETQMAVVQDQSLPGPPPAAHTPQRDQSPQPLEVWPLEDTEHQSPQEAQAVGLDHPASNDEAPSGNAPPPAHTSPPPVRVPEGRPTLDAGGSVQPRVHSRLGDLTERLLAHCDRVVEQDRPDNRPNDLSQVVELLQAPLQALTEALGTLTQSQTALVQTLGNLGELMRLQGEAIQRMSLDRGALEQQLQTARDLHAAEVQSHNATRQQLSALVSQQAAGSSRGLVHTYTHQLALQQHHVMAEQMRQPQNLPVAADGSLAGPPMTPSPLPTYTHQPHSSSQSTHITPTLHHTLTQHLSQPSYSQATYITTPSQHLSQAPTHSSQFSTPHLGYQLPLTGPPSHSQSTPRRTSHSRSHHSRHTTPDRNPTHSPT